MSPFYIFSMLFCHITAVYSSLIIQDSGVRLAAVGQTVTLRCSCYSQTGIFYNWYQQKLGGKPLLIAARMMRGQASVKAEYRDRFYVTGENEMNHLTISGLLQTDSAMYYCGLSDFSAIEFGEGVFLHVSTSLPSDPVPVHQPELVQLQLGHSLNLSCSTLAKECREEHNMLWFMHSAGKPAVIYQHVGHCVNESKSGTRNCTSYFSIKSANSSDAGMYYCAMASCGEIVFAGGTLVQLTGAAGKVTHHFYGLIVVSVMAVTLLLVLAFVLYKFKTQSCPICKGTLSHMSFSAAADALDQDENALHYAALTVKKNKEQQVGGQEGAEEIPCVYSTVRVRSRKE